MRPRKVNQAQRERILAIARSRRSLPTNKDLARECGVAVRTIESIITLELSWRTTTPRETFRAMIGANDHAIAPEVSYPAFDA